MKGKPSIDAFLGGAVAEATTKTPVQKKPVQRKPAPEEEPVAESPKFTKTIRLSRGAEILLKNEAHKRSMASGRRVTESDLIEKAIMQYLNK
jgi:hypothetical protein